MSNFDRLKDAGLADEGWTQEERDEVNDVSEGIVNKIIAAHRPTTGMDGGGGMQG